MSLLDVSSISFHIIAKVLSKILVFSILVLIFAGALVKSHEVGLSVPDWPTTYGYQMFSFPFSDIRQILPPSFKLRPFYIDNQNGFL